MPYFQPSVAPLLCDLLRRKSGSVAVEFAVIGPVMFALVGGIIESSLLLYTWGNMEHLARQAARGAAIGHLTAEEAEAFVAGKLKESIAAPDATVDVTFATGALPAANQVIVDVSVPGSELAEIQPFGFFQTVTLSSTVTMHREVQP